MIMKLYRKIKKQIFVCKVRRHIKKQEKQMDKLPIKESDIEFQDYVMEKFEEIEDWFQWLADLVDDSEIIYTINKETIEQLDDPNDPKKDWLVE